ncbi:MAG: FkbM family methyltransferase, partial [Pyrinomonadaceae bacterium]
LRSILQPGMTFFDVGANWGYFTLVAANQVGTNGRVVSFEPDPRIFARLVECVTRNGLSQVTPLQIAASAETSTLNLCGYDDSGDNFGLSRIAETVAGSQTFAVAARPLDDVIAEMNVEQIDLLKMDIEGYEGFALAGMKVSLAAHRVKRIILELHPNELTEHGHSADQIVEQLSSFGYRPYRIDHSPAAFRRASYSGDLEPKNFLMPMTAGAALDDWPHLVLTAPGIEL